MLERKIDPLVVRIFFSHSTVIGQFLTTYGLKFISPGLQ